MADETAVDLGPVTADSAAEHIRDIMAAHTETPAPQAASVASPATPATQEFTLENFWETGLPDEQTDNYGWLKRQKGPDVARALRGADAAVRAKDADNKRLADELRQAREQLGLRDTVSAELDRRGVQPAKTDAPPAQEDHWKKYQELKFTNPDIADEHLSKHLESRAREIAKEIVGETEQTRTNAQRQASIQNAGNQALTLVMDKWGVDEAVAKDRMARIAQAMYGDAILRNDFSRFESPQSYLDDYSNFFGPPPTAAPPIQVPPAPMQRGEPPGTKSAATSAPSPVAPRMPEREEIMRRTLAAVAKLDGDDATEFVNKQRKAS